MSEMIKQMGEDTGAGEVNSIDKGWPPSAAPRSMLKQQGEDRGDIAALLSGGHYDPSAEPGEGADDTDDEPSMYNGDKKPRVPGGTWGFDGVGKVGEEVSPYPLIDDVLFKSESVRSGFWSKDVVPVTVAPGNSKIVGDMGTGDPRDGSFSAPARLVGDLVTGLPNFHGENTDGGEQGPEAPVVGDLVTGDPQDDYPREEHLASELVGDLVTGDVKGGYAPGVNQPSGNK